MLTTIMVIFYFLIELVAKEYNRSSVIKRMILGSEINSVAYLNYCKSIQNHEDINMQLTWNKSWFRRIEHATLLKPRLPDYFVENSTWGKQKDRVKKRPNSKNYQNKRKIWRGHSNFIHWTTNDFGSLGY